MPTDDSAVTASSTYATAGGGTVLEHRYGATLLAALLTGDPVTELGDNVVPRLIHLQASAYSPVDDIVIEASDGDVQRRVSIGVRRDPELATSDAASQALLTSYLRIVLDHWADVSARRWRLALAVVSPNSAIKQLKQLIDLAFGSSDPEDFRTRSTTQGRTNGPARNRLKHLDALVAAAAKDLGGDTGIPPKDLTWRLLRALIVHELRLEGADQSDRTRAVGSLRAVTVDSAVASADDLFAALAELTTAYAPAGAVRTELDLRADLVGSRLRRSPTYAHAWGLLDGLGQRLRDSTPAGLRGGTISLELDRAEAREELAITMVTKADGGSLVVTGEPEVGKSALTLRVSADLAAAGAVVTALSLRDLPATVLELESYLQAPLADVLAGGAGSPCRLLVLDGAEVAIEGRAQLLLDVATAGLRAGLGVVAVTRRDAATEVLGVLRRGAEAARMSMPTEHFVAPLTDADARRLTTTFAALSSLGRDERSRWLLGRPGLIDLLLQAGVDPPSQRLLSEADVFGAVWGHMVRAGAPAGQPTPDQRDEAMTALVQRKLSPRIRTPRPDPAVLPALRSAGLLKSGEVPAAWRVEDDFASDLVRDFALARLLVVEDWLVLAEAGAPRWTIRAARIACQVVLLSRADPLAAWASLQKSFGDLGGRFGPRWIEVPTEALLTLGDGGALAEVWEQVSADAESGRTLRRLALQRYSSAGLGDPATVGPVVAHTLNSLSAGVRLGGQAGEDGQQIGELTLAWLAGLIQTSAGPNPLRQRVRDHILANDPPLHDEFTVKALASIGPDLDQAAESYLRRVAENDSHHLWPAVESVVTASAMARYTPQLLSDLTAAYYLDSAGRHGRRLREFGVRDHRGYSANPPAFWCYGPFWSLLQHQPPDALALINRILDHAASVASAEAERGVGPSSTTVPLPITALEIELADIGWRRYVGNEDMWSWYRSSSYGPYPCMSALLAVERFADELLTKFRMPIDQVVTLLLRDSHNLAMPGLVVGLISRHRAHLRGALDAWFARPEVWYLEIARTCSESLYHAHGPDDPHTVGQERRGLLPQQLTVEMMYHALLTEDVHRLNALASAGNELLGHAQGLLTDLESAAEEQLNIASWAAALQKENYVLTRADDHLTVEYRPPQEIEAGSAAGLAEAIARNDALRLSNTYAAADDRAGPVDTLTDDIAVARRLAAGPRLGGPIFMEDPIAAAAAAALVAHVRGNAVISREDLHWSAGVLLAITEGAPRSDGLDYADMTYPRGADRSAAVALPLLLLPALSHLGLDDMSVFQGLADLALNSIDEVRLTFAVACGPVWSAPCRATAIGQCRHQVLWEVAETGLRDARLGDWDTEGVRTLEPITPPYGPALADVPSQDLLVDRLVPPVVAAAGARATDCIGADAAERLLALLDAHRRGSDYWTRRGDIRHEDRPGRLIARILISLATEGTTRPLIDSGHLYANNPKALQEFLRSLRQVFTYNAELRTHLVPTWRLLMTTVLDAVAGGAELLADRIWSDWAVAGLLPTPSLNVVDADPDTVLREAWAGWTSPDEIGDLVVRWLPLATGRAKAVVTLASFLNAAPGSWNTAHGLSWVEAVIGDRYEAIANRSYELIEWLQRLRGSASDSPDEAATWRQIVDGLAAAGDRRAIDLQRLDE